MISPRLAAVLFSFYIVSAHEQYPGKLDAQEEALKKNPYLNEFQKTAHLRPTKCQVCRLLATELVEVLKESNKKEILDAAYSLDDESKKIRYDKSEIRLFDALEVVCDRMKSYGARAGPPFPYIKGARGHLREALDELMAKSKVKLKFDAPDHLIDDHTLELRRLPYKCVQMVEEYEDDISQWYLEHQDIDLITWLCQDKVLKDIDTDCLTASTDLPEDLSESSQEEEEESSDIEDQTDPHLEL